MPSELKATRVTLPLDELTRRIERSRLVSPERLATVCKQLAVESGGCDSNRLLQHLQRLNWITPWQTGQLLANQTEFFLGKYRLLERVGKGGMGAVYKAEQSSLGRIVAIKLMGQDLLKDDVSTKRFMREIEVAASLNHPNIVRAYDADCIGNRYFLVMEFVQGHDLEFWVKQRGPLPVPAACECVLQAALGLQHAHEHGLVHRDIKPANLLVSRQKEDPAPVIKLLDMGLARFVRDSTDSGLTATGTIMGTVDYMSPEQARNTRQADIRADIYSLGCTLFYLLTGRPPFTGTTAIEKLVARATEDAPNVRTLRPDVHPSVASIVAKMLSRALVDRYQTPLEVALALAPYTGRAAPLTPKLQSTAAELSQNMQYADQASTGSMELEELMVTTPVLDTVEEERSPTATPVPDSALDEFRGIVAPRSSTRLRRGRRKSNTGAYASLIMLLVLLSAGGGYLWYANSTKHAPPNNPAGPGLPQPPVASNPTNRPAPPGTAKNTPNATANAGTTGNTGTSVKPGTTPTPPTRPKPAGVGWPEMAVFPFDATQAKEFQQRWAAQFKVKLVDENSLGMKLVLIPPGNFSMGTPVTEAGRGENEAQRPVNIGQPFYMAECEVTQAQYERIMNRPPTDISTANHPAAGVSWTEAVEFCGRLSESADEKLVGRVYRLPSEQEWEYACRAGTLTPYYFGSDATKLGEHAWFNANSPTGYSRVGMLQPNPWGLYDVYGNVFEWCSDIGELPDHRMLRGGSIRSAGGALDCRSGRRLSNRAADHKDSVGFRVVCGIPTAVPQVGAQPVGVQPVGVQPVVIQPVSVQSAPASQWRSLFNGRDFTGWTELSKSDGVPGSYTVVQADGEPAMFLQSDTKVGIATEESFGDMHLRLEFKSSTLGNEDSTIDFGYMRRGVREHALRLRANTADVVRTGTPKRLVDIAELQNGAFVAVATIRAGAKPQVKASAPPNIWNRLEILVLNGTALHLVNGQLVCATTNPRDVEKDSSMTYVRAGKLSLLCTQGEILIRRIEVGPITELPPDLLAGKQVASP